MKIYIIVDEASDESKKEQMTLVLRFVDKDDFIRERFFDLAHVKDTSALTLRDKYVLFSLTIVLMFKIFVVRGEAKIGFERGLIGVRR